MTKIRKKVNVLYVIFGMFIGGAELVVYNLCKYINKEKFNIYVCYIRLNGPLGEELKSIGIEIFQLVNEERATIGKIFSFSKLSEFIRIKHINILHSHGTSALLESSLAKLFSSIIHIHTFHFGNYPNLSPKKLFIERLFWKVPNKLVAVGDVQKEKIIQTYKIPSGRILTIRNGVEQKQATSKNIITSFNKPDGIFIIGSISTLTEQKGITYLLDVAKLLKERNCSFKVIIVGDGPLRDQLEKKRNDLELKDFVEFLGWIEDASNIILPYFDVFIQPSLWEAMSMVILEAFAAGIPVIATSVGENSKIIQNGENGYLVDPGDILSMANKIEYLMHNKEVANNIKSNARKLFEEEFKAESMAKKYEELYLSFLQSY